MILSLEIHEDSNKEQIESDNNDEYSFQEVSYLSKWNQIENIVQQKDDFHTKFILFKHIDWDNVDDTGHGERFKIIHSFLVKQGNFGFWPSRLVNISVIRRLIDCCNESPTMPDFCSSWFKLFRLFSIYFPHKFILQHVQPLITFELGLFNNSYNFDNLLLPSYVGALIGPLVHDCEEFKHHFSLAMREALIWFGTKLPPSKSNIFELTTEMVLNKDWINDTVVTKIISGSVIGVLWEGVTHENENVRILTVRALTCAIKTLSIVEISTQLFPPINSLVHDTSPLVRSESAKTVSVLQQRLHSEAPDPDLEKRTMKLIMQLLVDQDSAVVENIIRAMMGIVIENDNSFREDFFIPQIGRFREVSLVFSVESSLKRNKL